MPGKRARQKYERQKMIYVGSRKPFQGVEFDEQGQIAKVILESGERVKPDTVFSTTEYERASGKRKVVTHIPDIATFDEISSLRRNFDAVIVTDTNTRSIREESYSVSIIGFGLTKNFTCIENPTGLSFRPNLSQNACLFFKGCNASTAEKFSIWKAITLLRDSRPHSDKMRIAVITDHDLNNHANYNSGQAPIFGVFTLPPNVTLLYATTDSGNNGLFTGLLRMCDRTAAGILRQLRDKGMATLEDGKELRLEGFREFSEIATGA